MKPNRSLVISVAFTLFLTLGGALTWLLPNRAVSENENRYLQTTPSLSVSALLNGTYQEELTAYMNDQFPLRDIFTATGSLVKKTLGRRDIGGAYIGKNGWYFEKVTDTDISQARYTNNLTVLTQFAKRNAGITFTVMPVPSAGTVMAEQLPTSAPLYNAQKLYAVAERLLPENTLLDLRAPLTVAAKTEQVYYRTDHHWTTAGAAVAYTALTGNQAPARATVSNAFLGTLYSNTLDIATSPDTVEIAEIAPSVTAVADGVSVPVYDTAQLQEKDKYRLFLGGNHGKVTLSGGCQNGETLLIIKDSFANCLAPMLTNDYETVILLDLRYYNGSVQELLAENFFSRIVVCYELNKLANDTNLQKLLQ